jgi:hypothetical protein
MNMNKTLLATAILSASLVGCGGSSSSSNNDNDKQSSGLACSDTVCTLEGTITQDLTLTADKEWRLNGFVTVGTGNVELADEAAVAATKAAGVTLTIEPGVHVKAFNTGVLLITRGSKIEAEGTAAQPITFSSIEDDNFDGEGEWGGVVVQGFAPQYGAGNTGPCFGTGTVCNVDGEGGDGIGKFGGNDKADNSGTIKYVRIAEAGRVAGPNNEINGLTLQGVGHATTVDYIQVHNNLDDGIEWFGGTVNVTHAVLTNNDDDDIDFDEGYQGNIQYAIIRKNPNKTTPSGSNDPRGIEANSSDEDYVEATQGAIANVTIVGSEVNKSANSKGDGLQPGMRLRGSLTARVYNSAVLNFDDCVRIDDSDHDKNDTTAKIASDVTLSNVIGQCDDKFYAKRVADSEVGTVGAATLDLDEAVALTVSSVAQVDFAEVDNGSGFAFDNTTYVGAVAPGTSAASAWWAGWTIPGSLTGIETQGE